MRTLNNDTLTLEPQIAAHAAEMFAVLSDPAIYEYENAPPVSLEWLCDRYAKLESRRSADGRERWLNWVIRLSSGELIGFVQATARPDGQAAIAYELSSAYWGRGLASLAVETMIVELANRYAVRSLSATLKCKNLRSRRLLDRLGFSPVSPEQHPEHAIEPDELLMMRELR